MQLEKKPYYVYLGRMTQRKGVDVASQACEAAGVELIMAGSGTYIPKYGTYIGEVNADERKKLLGRNQLKNVKAKNPAKYSVGGHHCF